MNYIKLIPRRLRQVAYDKLIDELRKIDERDVALFGARVLAAARKVLAL